MEEAAVADDEPADAPVHAGEAADAGHEAMALAVKADEEAATGHDGAEGGEVAAAPPWRGGREKGGRQRGSRAGWRRKPAWKRHWQCP